MLTDYEYNKHVKGSNIYRVKTSVSSLKEEDFAEASQENQKQQTAQILQPTSLPPKK